MEDNERQIIELLNRSNNKNEAVKVALDLLIFLLTSQKKMPEDLQVTS